MRRDEWAVESPAIGTGGVVAYGHYGRPLLAFPSDGGRRTDFEDRGMVGAVGDLVEAGRVKLYCVDSFDDQSWRNNALPLEERARRHAGYEDWVVNHVVPRVHADCGGPTEVMLTGCSFGAYHAANFALKRADLFPLAICMSGVYDVAAVGGGWERGDAVYFNNPTDYMANADGDHLDWLRRQVHLVLVCGQGMWEDTTGALESTKAFAGVLDAKGVPHELDLWGYDVPHDWPSWRAQLAHHLPRFC
ncbi:MAG TPA: alpha/beta hydrolase-fold protein [Actinomycetes bacterium]|jgi:esterase/lipase superfamily enzyme|nr:alpha/beta hydrolase-fold protein [Actinomycetes bacterium]